LASTFWLIFPFPPLDVRSYAYRGGERKNNLKISLPNNPYEIYKKADAYASAFLYFIDLIWKALPLLAYFPFRSHDVGLHAYRGGEQKNNLKISLPKASTFWLISRSLP